MFCSPNVSVIERVSTVSVLCFSRLCSWIQRTRAIAQTWRPWRSSWEHLLPVHLRDQGEWEEQEAGQGEGLLEVGVKEGHQVLALEVIDLFILFDLLNILLIYLQVCSTWSRIQRSWTWPLTSCSHQPFKTCEDKATFISSLDARPRLAKF